MNNDNKDEIKIIWHIADVKSIAKDLTDKECREVLSAVLRNHDAGIGVNWDTLKYWANEVRDNKE